ncbi:MAG: hypothetical protein RRY34_10530, partial [Victivallaceae bacterium]
LISPFDLPPTYKAACRPGKANEAPAQSATASITITGSSSFLSFFIVFYCFISRISIDKMFFSAII